MMWLIVCLPNLLLSLSFKPPIHSLFLSLKLHAGALENVIDVSIRRFSPVSNRRFSVSNIGETLKLSQKGGFFNI